MQPLIKVSRIVPLPIEEKYNQRCMKENIIRFTRLYNSKHPGSHKTLISY